MTAQPPGRAGSPSGIGRGPTRIAALRGSAEIERGVMTNPMFGGSLNLVKVGGKILFLPDSLISFPEREDHLRSAADYKPIYEISVARLGVFTSIRGIEHEACCSEGYLNAMEQLIPDLQDRRAFPFRLHCIVTREKIKEAPEGKTPVDVKSQFSFPPGTYPTHYLHAVYFADPTEITASTSGSHIFYELKGGIKCRSKLNVSHPAGGDRPYIPETALELARELARGNYLIAERV
jgi:hypothetical protein